MRMAKFSRTSAAILAAALLATACSSDPDTGTDPTEGETTGSSETPAGDGYDWTDVRRRQAVSMAIDREAITTAIFNGARAPADDFWPATFAGYRGNGFCDNLSYNPERAKTLWDEAGGTTGPVTLWFNSGAGHEEWVEAVANQLRTNLGVEDVQFQSLEFADYLDKLDAAEVDGPFRLGWGMDYPSPGNFLGPIHATAGSSNRTGYSNPAFDAAVEAGDSKDVADAVGDYQAAGDILCEDVPILPMFFGRLNGVTSNNVSDVEFDAFQTLNVTKVKDGDGDGVVSVYVCEPQSGLFGQMTNESCGNEVVNGLFTGLVKLDKASGTLDYTQGVAESIETTDDGSNWVIKLKSGWTFHDGTPVNSASFVDAWNWAAAGANASPNQYFLDLPGIEGFADLNPEEGAEATATEMSGLAAPDDSTITVKLTKAFPQFPLLLLYGAYNPLPTSFFDDPAAFGESPIGNGPFMIDGSWEHDVQIKTVAFDGYAGEKPNVSSIVYTIYSTDTTGYNDLRSDALDIMDTVPTSELANYQTEFAGRFIDEQVASFNYMGFPIDLELVASWGA